MVLQKPLVQVCATQSSRSSEEDDSSDDDKATERSISVVPDSQPPTPRTAARVYANPWSIPSSTEEPAPLQTRLGFEDNPRGYHDFRVYHISFKLTLGLVTNPDG